MMKLAISIALIILLFFTAAIAQDVQYSVINTDTSSYGLQDIIAIALQNNPGLQALKLELQAADARIVQSGLWPNPVFTAESENFSGDLPGFNYTENTFSLEQPLLLGGKIDLKKQLSEQEILILSHHYESEKIALISEIEHRVYHVLVTQKILQYTRESQENTRKLYDFMQEKMNANDTKQTRYEILSAQIELSQAELAVADVERDLEIAKKNLSILCGGDDCFFKKIQGDLDRKFNIPEYDDLKDIILKNNFNVKSAEAYGEKAGILLEIAKADRIPDVDLGFGVRQFEEDNSYTFVAGLTVPLPVFNRNQGSIQEAKINKDKVVLDKKILVNEILITLNEYYNAYQISLQQVGSYKNSILPNAQEYYTLVFKNYEKGSLDYLDALVAERKLIETKRNYAEALHTLQNAVANLENLCSQHFHGTNGEIF